MTDIKDDYRIKPSIPGLATGIATPRAAETLAGEMQDAVTRIESLKIKLLRYPIANGERDELFRELDLLRAALFQPRLGATAPELNTQKSTTPVPSAKPELKLEGIIGAHPRIRKILNVIAKVAPTDLAILLEGETGSGKELFARMIHNNSGRGNFVAVNCGAFPSGLIESELFGHVKGAFTGAAHDRKGKFEEANNGTIFLDEIGELEMPAQVKLLRVLQEGELQRVGSDVAVKTRARVIAATHRNLADMVANGQFREDLFYRINLCPLFIPPLRERRDEIRILFDYFFQQLAAAQGTVEPVLARDLQAFLYDRYAFPGNIRELKNLAYYLAHLADNRALTLQDLPERYQDPLAGVMQPELGDGETRLLSHAKGRAEREALVSLLQRHNGRIQPVCEALQLSRARLYQLLTKYRLKPAEFRDRKRLR